MAHFRQTLIRKDHSIATSGTDIFDLKLDDYITRLVIHPKVTNPNAYVAVGHPDEIIEKIQVVDGSDVLVDLEGIQAVPLAYYGTKRSPVRAMNYMALQWAFAPIEIYFGRYLGDPELALDPARFNNLQLKITHNIDAAMTSAATGYIDVALDVMRRDAFAPTGMLVAKEIQAHSITQSATEYTDLPQDMPIRQLVGVCFSDTEAPEYNVDKFELYEGQKTILLTEYDMVDYQALTQSLFPPVTEKIYGRALTTDLNFWITPAFERVAVLNDYGEQNKVITPESTGGQKLIVSAEATAVFEGIVHGWAPHGSTPFVMPVLDDPAYYLDLSPRGGGTLKLTFASGADTTPTYDVVAQQLRRY